MLDYESALRQLLESVEPLPAESVELTALADADAPARPRHLAAAVESPVALPPFDNSAVDGYAVRAVDSRNPDDPLRVARCIAAGDPPGDVPLPPGQLIRIFTGAPLPPGADAVVMQEDCRVEPDGSVRILDPVKPWENVRFRGDDIRAGTRIVEAGDPLTAARIGLLQACGLGAVQLHRSPTVAVVASGSELRRAGTPLPPGCIWESNLVPIARLIESAGGRVIRTEIILDDPEATRRALEAASQADVLVTVGGASVGDHDHFRDAAAAQGFDIDFWRIAMKPGKPFFAGRRSSPTPGMDGTPHVTRLFGLPGNPVSAFVTALILVLPALRRLAGSRALHAPARPVILGEPLSNPDRRRHFMRVSVDASNRARSSGIQASHILASLAVADGVVDVPPQTTLEAGITVPMILFPA